MCRTYCDQLARERDDALAELEDAIADRDEARAAVRWLLARLCNTFDPTCVPDRYIDMKIAEAKRLGVKAWEEEHA